MLPVLDSQMFINVLREGNVNKVNASKIKGSNKDLSMWMKVKTLREVVLPNNTPVYPGQQIVNKGEPFNGTYCLIDTVYKKCYEKKVKDMLMNDMKTPSALNKMTSLPGLFCLFKCMDKKCAKSFTSKELFKTHLNYHFSHPGKIKKNEMYDPEQFKKCAYCFRKFDNVDSLADHIVEKYTFCEYFCPHCFYRAYTASHVLAHLSVFHEKLNPLILKLEYDEGVDENPKEILMAVDFNEFVLPYNCSVGSCAFSCYLPNEFISHLNQEHQQCDKFCCYICAGEDNGEGFFALHPSLMIKHFKLHNINMYQCIFCLFGTEVDDQMITHLALEHFEYEPMCLERTTMSSQSNGSKIENLKIIRINKAIDNGLVQTVNLPHGMSSLSEIIPLRSKKRRLECPDVLSAAMKSARIDESIQPQETIVITVPDRAQMAYNSTSPTTDSEFIMLDDDVNQNDVQDTLKINSVWTKTKNNEKELQQSVDDVIVIDDDDDLLDNDASPREEGNTEILTKRKRTAKHSNGNFIVGSNKMKRLALPLIALDKLFVCKECDQVFSNSIEYQNHLNQCPYWNIDGQKCIFCSKLFKTVFNMTEHLKLHGPNRFRCNTCGFYVPSSRAIALHMKDAHNVTHLAFVPVHVDLNDLEKDEFIVYEDETLEQTKFKFNLSYNCGECSFVGNSRKSIHMHLKKVHDIHQYKICAVTLSKDKFTQEYVIRKIESESVAAQQQQHTSYKRKRSSDNSYNVGKKKEFSKAKDIQDKTKDLLFSPNDIESIPNPHIFSDLVGCSLCTYTTKVRSNLIMHLNGHKKGQDNTTKEIVNPVPSIGKTDPMFDKMINLSASSFEAMNTEKMKIIELNKKIVEVAPGNNFDIEIFPRFIQKNKRYQCSVSGCTYTGMNEEMLKKHISVLHSSHKCYLCPHCAPNCALSKVVGLHDIEFHLMHHSENLYLCQYCDYIDFNRLEMRAHMRNIHLSQITRENQSNIIVIRQRMLEDENLDRNRYQAQSTEGQWVCNICSAGIKYSENEITSHVFMAHNVSNQFKCPMCQFEHNDNNPKVFEEHYKLKHPSVAVKCLKVFDKISEIEEQLHKQSKHLLCAANLQEQQALESIEPTLVPPTCRGIPVESIPNKTSNKSRGVSKSPKSAAKNSLVQARKQKILTDVFSKGDSLGTISSNGLFTCPRCIVFETGNVESFREHLLKDIHYKTWKCMKCFEVSDSPKKMAWHVKKHGNGTKYEKIENVEKLNWVEKVVEHQNSLYYEFKKNNQEKLSENRVRGVEPTINPPLQKYVESSKIVIDSSQTTHPLNDDIINLLDDSEDE